MGRCFIGLEPALCSPEFATAPESTHALIVSLLARSDLSLPVVSLFSDPSQVDYVHTSSIFICFCSILISSSWGQNLFWSFRPFLSSLPVLLSIISLPWPGETKTLMRGVCAGCQPMRKGCMRPEGRKGQNQRVKHQVATLACTGVGFMEGTWN